MARFETTTIHYETTLARGARESSVDGFVHGDGPDEPFEILVLRHAKVEVRDGRGLNYEASREASSHEEVLRLSISEAGQLTKALADDLTYIAEVLERRVLVPEPKES